MKEFVSYYEKIKEILDCYEDFVHNNKYITKDLEIYDVMFDFGGAELSNDGVLLPTYQYLVSLLDKIKTLKNSDNIELFSYSQNGILEFRTHKYFRCVANKTTKKLFYDVFIENVDEYFICDLILLGEPLKVTNEGIVQDRNEVFHKIVVLYNTYKDIPFCKQYILYLDSLFEKLENNEIIKIEPFYYE